MTSFLASVGSLLLLFSAQPLAAADDWRRVLLPAGLGMVSCLAMENGLVAVGSVSGGVAVLDTTLAVKSLVNDPLLGKNGEIFSLAWGSHDLWIASEGGLYRYDPESRQLDRTRKDVPVGVRTGVRALAVNGDAVWCASAKGISVFDPSRKRVFREWKSPIQDEPTVLLRVGGRILVGTSSKGLLLLDSATGAWIRLGRNEGLASDQVTGLEWVGAEVFVATPEGMDIFDLSTQKLRSLLPNLIASWTTQSNGSVFVSTVDGVVKVDASTHASTQVALPPGARGEGALLAQGGNLLVAGGSELLASSQPTLLGHDNFRLTPDGVSLVLPGKIPAQIQVQAFLRIPEWPEAKMALTANLIDDGSRLVVRTPSDLRGLVQIDLVASSGSKVEEVRSLECVGDRTKPSLLLDSMLGAYRAAQVEIAGKASGVGNLVLTLGPGEILVPLAADGSFRQIVDLQSGDNRFELRLEDGIGNRSTRDLLLRRDDKPPSFEAVPDDTVPGDFSRIRVKFHDAGTVRATARGAAQLHVSVFDSFVVLESHRLAVGVNQIQIILEDEAGNVASKVVQVVRRPATGVQVNSWSLENLSATGASGGGIGAPDEICRSVHLVHYTMVEGGTLCGVAEMFYGSQSLAEILIRWNGFADSSQWRRMPVGTPVDVPFWRDLDYRNPDVKAELETFPWDRIPLGPRDRK
jgi:hypothetical protein